VKEDQIRAAELQVLKLKQVAVEFEAIEKEAMARKERLSELWNEIITSFKKIYKAPSKQVTAFELGRLNAQNANWLESRYLDDPETKEAIYEMFGPIDKSRLFELVIQTISENPNYQR